MLVCVKCELELFPKQNGVMVERIEGIGSFELWEGDLWACRKCGMEVIADFGQKPWARAGNVDYARQRAKVGPVYKVRDQAVKS